MPLGQAHILPSGTTRNVTNWQQRGDERTVAHAIALAYNYAYQHNVYRRDDRHHHNACGATIVRFPIAVVGSGPLGPTQDVQDPVSSLFVCSHRRTS